VRSARRPVVGAAACLLLACNGLLGIDELAATDVDGGSEGGSDASSGGDAIVPDPAPDGGWALVLVSADGGACPVGMSRTSYVTSLQATPGACGCGPVDASPPNCATGTFATTFDNTPEAGCGLSGKTLDGGDGACEPWNANFALHFAGTPLPPTGGSCAADGVVLDAAVTAQPIAVCASPSCNADAGCLAPAGYQTCVVQAGSHLCPAEYPKRSLAGVSGSVGACSPCSCSVSGATCSGALLYAYPNANCQGDAGLVVPVNGACVPSNNYVFQSLRYAATPSAQYVTTPGTPSVSFKSFVSICCR